MKLKKRYPIKYPNSAPSAEKTVAIKAINKNFFLSATTIGIIITSGGIGKKELSINEKKAKRGLENLCLANCTHLSYSFFIISLLCLKKKKITTFSN